jgi:hypothetical protein
MTGMVFKKATKEQAKLRMGIIGPAGSGKTYTALLTARNLVPDGKIAVLDTERGSASKYADIFEFDVCELESFHPENYIKTIQAAEEAGYDVLIIDSLSHAWTGKDGALELVDKAAARERGNSFAAWRHVTPLHNAMVDAMIGARLHLIVTMRSKVEWVVEKDERGKSVPRKIGLQPVQRDGLEYEFDVVADMDLDNNFIVSKTRCPALRGKVINLPNEEPAKTLRAWLSDGVPVVEPEEPEAKETFTAPKPSKKAKPEQVDSDKERLFRYIAGVGAALAIGPETAIQATEALLKESYNAKTLDEIAPKAWSVIYKNRDRLVEKAIEPLVATGFDHPEEETA